MEPEAMIPKDLQEYFEEWQENAMESLLGKKAAMDFLVSFKKGSVAQEPDAVKEDPVVIVYSSELEQTLENFGSRKGKEKVEEAEVQSRSVPGS
jgi:hypothetical protein